MNRKTIIQCTVIVLLTACSGGTESNTPSTSIGSSASEMEQASNNVAAAEHNANVELIAKLEKIAPLKDYKVIGEIHLEELTFNEFSMGDMAHILFTDGKNETHDFAGNQTDTQLFLETEENIEENMGYLSNPKYVGKKFQVGWRHVKLTRQPTDFLEEFYREYDEIIYLKKLN